MSKYRAAVHPIDENGAIVHEDIDPFIPTGVCAYCAGAQQATEPPENRSETHGQDD